MDDWHPKIMSEMLRPKDTVSICGPCANKRKVTRSYTSVTVGFTRFRGEDSNADFCAGHRKELGQLISGRISMAEWPTYMTGDFWSD